MTPHALSSAKKSRSATIIRHFMKDMGKCLQFTVACRKFKKIVRFVQHHWHGRLPGREARKDLLMLQLMATCKKETEQAAKDVERFIVLLELYEAE